MEGRKEGQREEGTEGGRSLERREEGQMYISYSFPCRHISRTVCRVELSEYFKLDKGKDFICSEPFKSGITKCSDIPVSRGILGQACTGSGVINLTLIADQCTNWNQYYTVCKPGAHNPFQGAISFDNIGLAWVAIFQVRFTV